MYVRAEDLITVFIGPFKSAADASDHMALIERSGASGIHEIVAEVPAGTPAPCVISGNESAEFHEKLRRSNR